MKKFYLALAAAAVSVTAFGATKADLNQNAPVNSVMAQSAIEAVIDDYNINPDNVIGTKSYVDQNGNMTIMVFSCSQMLSDYFTTDEVYPYWGVETITRTQNAKTGDWINDCPMLLAWPTVYSYNSEEFLYGSNDPNFQPDLSIIPFDEFWKNAASGKGPRGFRQRRSDSGGVYFVTLNDAQTAIDSYAIFGLSYSNSNAVCGGVTIPSGTTLNDGVSCYCTGYEDDVDGDIVTLSLNLTYGNGAAMTMTYTGTVSASGIPGYANRIDLNKLYIWNAGVMSGELDDAYTFFPVMDWGPLQQLYFVATGAGVQAGVSTADVGDGSFAISKIKNNFLEEGYDFAPTATFNAVRGMLMAPVGFDLTKPHGVWTVVTPTVVGNRMEVTPEAFMAFPGGNASVGFSGTPQQPGYGMVGCLWQYYKSWVGTSKLAIGTEKGFEFNAVDAGGAKYVASCNADIKMFNELTRYSNVKSTGTVPSILDDSGVETITGDVYTAEVNAANGMITINAANDAMVNVYTINGALINSVNVKAGAVKNIAVEKGAYIVKVGNKATKVIL